MPDQSTLQVDDFVAKWKQAALREKPNAQTHFNDLCAVLDVDPPVDGDPNGDTYRFEKPVALPGGESGTADVWKADHFGWEYKSGGKSLTDAYTQLLGYREGLGNPPVLVVSDMHRFEIHTNFTNTAHRIIAFDLNDLNENPTFYLKTLRSIFLDPYALHPDHDPRYITETAALMFAEVAEALRADDHDPAAVARFLNRIIFCCFAESVGLFDDLVGRRNTPLRDTLETLSQHPDDTEAIFGSLFAAMAREDQPVFGPNRIRWFNGGLFNESAPTEIFRLTGDLAQILLKASELNWSRIDPAILGTLFERGLDPKRRSQLGAHFTDLDSILRVIEPVVMRPLRREFEALKQECATLAEPGGSVRETPAPYNGSLDLPDTEDEVSVKGRIRAFHDRLTGLRVLDPACGSGNFLYAALRELKSFEQEFLDWASASYGMGSLNRRIGPHNLLGIDSDSFAVDLTRVSIWIGEIQWSYERGIRDRPHPILGRIDQIECRDAILDWDDTGSPVPAQWPEADYIIGNPPFLGMKRMRQELGNKYVDRLRTAWADSLDGRVDLCVYWHEQARRQIEQGAAKRAGLLATQNIRGVFSRPVLERIADTGAIFDAYSDEPWVNDGAAVRIAIIAQDDRSETDTHLDGASVPSISPALSARPYLGRAVELPESASAAFQGDIRNGEFDVSFEVGTQMLAALGNPNGKPNSDVVFRFVTGQDLARRPRGMHIIDFGIEMSRRDAAMYEQPFEYIKEHVYPYRQTQASERLKDQWWRHEAWRPAMRAAIAPLSRYIVTPLTSKYRFYVWQEPNVVPDATCVAIACEDDYTFGVLHSRIHEVWALANATRLADGTNHRYVHTQCFTPFAFPWPLSTPEDELDPEQRRHSKTIAAAAVAYDQAREQWLSPPGISRELLQDRTMTALYNQRPDWLDDAHEAVGDAVFAAYGWPATLEDDEILQRLLDLNLERAAAQESNSNG